MQREGELHSNEQLPRANRWAITLGTIRDIPIRVHLTFFLIFLWVGSDEGGWAATVVQGLLLLLIFASVLLHELGHALVARRYNIRTRDITLYPFGGIATLSGMASAQGEFWIAIAGPLVNFAIGAVLLGVQHSLPLPGLVSDIVRTLTFGNFFIGIFNLIPALPMDGGRILRAVLEMAKVKQATVIAARVSQLLCIVLGVYALVIGNPILAIIAVFIFLSAMRELISAKAKRGAIGHAVKEAMFERSQMQPLGHGMTISEAVGIALKSIQPVFPVLLGDRLMGIISRDTILQAAATQETEQYVSGLMSREVPFVNSQLQVESLMQQFETGDREYVAVEEDGRFVGLIFKDRLFEFVFLEGLRQERAEQAAQHH